MAEEFVSKTRRKQEMHALQDIGEALVGLNPDQLDTLALPERLLEAVIDAKHVAKFEARRRQMQYIGRLMRDIDVAPIRERLDAWNGVSVSATAELHQLERWRERLIAEEAAFDEFAMRYPRADFQRLRQLARNAQRERSSGAPPRSARELFRLLREVIGQDPGPPPAAS